MEYKMKLIRQALERFCRWGKVAICVETLGLLLWGMALLSLLVFKKSFGVEFFLWFGSGALCLFLPIVLGITKFASARKFCDFHAVTFGCDRIEFEREGSPVIIPFSELRMSYIQSGMLQMFHVGTSNLFVIVTKTQFFALADVFFDDPTAARIAFKNTKEHIDRSRESEGVMTAYAMCLSYETPDGEMKISNPSWEQIETAIQALEGQRHTLVGLTAGDAGTLLIGGGNGQYIITALFGNNSHLTAGKSEADSIDVELTVGGQTGIYSSNKIWPLDIALQAARQFVDTGSLDSNLEWTEP